MRGPVRVLVLAGMLALAVSAGSATATAVATTGIAAVEGDVPDRAPGFPWHWPSPTSRTVIVPFRAPAHDYGAGHRGMDVAASTAVEVLAPAPGVVAFRGVVVDRPLLTIDHGDGYVTTLEPVSSTLLPGDAVEAGEVVGTVAAGGHAAHGTLHVGVRVDKRYVNPRGLFGTPPRAVLLPCCER